MFLLVVALLLFLAAHREERLTGAWLKWRWPWKLASVMSAGMAVAFGWYLAANFNEPPPTVVDDIARERASDLQAQVARLEGQVKAAMEFQAVEKTEREATQKRSDDARRARRALYDHLSKLVEDGRKKRLDLFNMKLADAVSKFEEWRKTTSATLMSISLPDCASAFDNPVHGPRVSYGIAEDRNVRAFMAVALIASLEQCRTNHAQQ